MTEITILTAEDQPHWHELWGAYLDFYQIALPAEVFEHTWARIAAGGPILAFAARNGGRMIGLTHFLYHPTAWATADACYLQDLFVTAEARGQGTARALIEAVAAHARERQAARLYWLTQADNATARILYDRIAKHTGFIRYEYPPLAPAA